MVFSMKLTRFYIEPVNSDINQHFLMHWVKLFMILPKMLNAGKGHHMEGPQHI